MRDGDGDLVDVGRTPLRVLATPDGVWVSVFGAGEVVLVDPATSRVVRRFDGFDEPEGLAAAAGVVWVVDQARGTLTGVAADGTRTAPVAVGHGPRLAAAGPSGVAATSYADGTVTVVDPGTATGRTSPRLCSGPQGVIEHDGTLWVACTSDGSLVQVDPTTLTTIRVVPDLPGADAVVAGPVGTVLAVLAEGPTVVAVRTADGSVRSRMELSDAPPVRDGNVDAVLDGARLWVSSPVRGELLAVDLPTLLGPDGTDPP